MSNVGKLKLNKETIRRLTDNESIMIHGGLPVETQGVLCATLTPTCDACDSDNTCNWPCHKNTSTDPVVC